MIFVTNKDITRVGGIESFIRRLFNFNKERNVLVSENDIKRLREYERRGCLLHYFDFSLRYSFIRNLCYENKIVTPFLVFSHIKRNIYTKVKLKMFIRNYTKVHSISPRIHKFLNSIGVENDFILPPVDKKFFINETKSISNRTIVSYIGRFDKDKGTDRILKMKLNPRTEKVFVLSYYYGRAPAGIRNITKGVNIKLIKYNKLSVKKGEKQVMKLLKTSHIVLFPFKTLRNTLDIPLLILESIASRSVPVITDDSNEIKENEIFNDFIFADLRTGIDHVKQNYKYYQLKLKRFLRKHKFETSYVYKRLYNE